MEGYGEYNRAFQIKPIMTLDYNSNIDEIEQGSYKRTLIFDKSIYELIHKDKTETYKI